MSLNEQMDSDIKNVFLQTDDFSEQFVFSRSGLTIDAIFDNEFSIVVEDVESTAPEITAADTDIVGVVHSDTFTNVETSAVYNVIGIQPDGTGLTLLVLSLD